MNVYNVKDKQVPFGYGRCWACGQGWSLVDIVTQITKSDGTEWLISHGYLQDVSTPDFNSLIGGWKFTQPQTIEFKSTYTEEQVKEFSQWYHPYLNSRHISPFTAAKFKLGYDAEHKSVTFPIYDIEGNLITVTERNVDNKRFMLEKNVPKYIYLLDNAVKFEHECLKCFGELKPIFVVESQINALTLEEWGFTAIALMGTGCPYQYELIKNNLLTRSFYLCFDGDDAGDEGANRFIVNFPHSIKVNIPRGKDVNDLDYDKFISLIS